MSTDDKTRSREEAQDEHTESPATSAGAKKEHNEHVVIIPKDKNENTLTSPSGTYSVNICCASIVPPLATSEPISSMSVL